MLITPLGPIKIFVNNKQVIKCCIPSIEVLGNIKNLSKHPNVKVEEKKG